MSDAAKVTAWLGAAAAVLGVLLAARTYGANRADSFTQAAVAHESRHVVTEADVERIDDSMQSNFKIIQSQLAAGHEMNLVILKQVMEK